MFPKLSVWTRLFALTTWGAIASLFVACGGPQITLTKPVELSIPPDLAKAYEVKDLQSAQEASAAEKEKVETAKKERRKRGGKGISKKDSAPAAGSKPKEENQLEGIEGIAGPGKQKITIPNRRPEKDPLWVNEKIWMDVSWLNTKAGEFLLEVLPFKMINGRKVYDIKGSARTSDLFSLIYKAEDWVETFVDYEGWFPYKFILHGDETRHIRNHLELFDHGAKKQYIHIHDYRVLTNEVHEDKGLKDLSPFSQDALSGLYYARTLNLSEGNVQKFPMSTNGSQWETSLIVVAREEVSTKMGYLKAIKTKVETRFNGVLQQQGDAFIWFSDDDRKYPLRFEAKVRIGWVEGVAKKIDPGVPEAEWIKSVSGSSQIGVSGPSDLSSAQSPAQPGKGARGSEHPEGRKIESKKHGSAVPAEEKLEDFWSAPNIDVSAIQKRPNTTQRVKERVHKVKNWFRHLLDASPDSESGDGK